MQADLRKQNTQNTTIKLYLHRNLYHSDANYRFHHVNFEVAERIADLDDPSSVCANQEGVLTAGAVKSYPCNHGGVLPIDVSRYFIAGCYAQLRMYTGSSDNRFIHVQEIEVHGY